jgi:CelD/BcsL family acetyltransferase involved in cellulose biosynthesis
MDWDHLEFLDLMEDSPLLRPSTLPRDARPFSRGRCPIADLADGFEAYLKRLSLKSREQARRVLREGERAGAQLELVDAVQAAGAFEDLVRLHQERWTSDGKPGVFAAARFTEFHRNLVQEWLPTGRAVLARLSFAGVPAAVLYGFVNGRKFDSYLLGARRESGSLVHSPGVLANLLLMRALTERGVTAYDFLRGSSSYKQRQATQENQLVGIRIWRPTVRAAIYRSVQLAARVFNKGQRLMRRS